eukprot:scaffold39953_cov266-Skeletonema_dohrnii-CCMP3373.AAC.2
MTTAAVVVVVNLVTTLPRLSAHSLLSYYHSSHHWRRWIINHQLRLTARLLPTTAATTIPTRSTSPYGSLIIIVRALVVAVVVDNVDDR